MWIFFQRLRSFGKTGRAPRGRLHRAGFTLVELLVVSAIIVILTTVLLLRQSTFDSSTILRSVAYSVALSVRQAQVYGTSVLGTASGGSIQYATAYGLYFNRSNPTTYALFADFNSNGVYDASTETLKVFSLTNGFSLADACATLSSGANRCLGSHDSSGLGTTASLSILFRRPNPDAVFRTEIGGESYTSAWVGVQSQNKTLRSILVTSTGQISVQVLGTMP